MAAGSDPLTEAHSFIDDLIQSETLYTENLRNLKIHFTDKLLHDAQSPKPQILPFDPDSAVFFSSVGQLLTVHQSFLQELEEKRKLCTISGYIEVLSRFATLFRVYTQYVAGCFNIMQKIQQTFDSPSKGRKLRELLHTGSVAINHTEGERRSTGMTDSSEEQSMSGYSELVRLLSIPLNRVPNYSRELEDFSSALKKIVSGQVPAATIEGWMRQLSAVDQALDKTSKAIQHTNTLEGQRGLIIDLESQWSVKFSGTIGRLFIKDGPLVKVSRSKDIAYMFLLFSDILCYGAPRTGTIATLNGNSRGMVAHHRTIPLSKVTISASNSRENAFQIISDEKSFVVVAPNLEDRDDWLTKLSGALQEQNQRSNQSKSVVVHADSAFSDDGLGSTAPVWKQDHDVGNCTVCSVSFTLINRRHHCRRCGNIVCNSCSNHKFPKHRVIVGTAPNSQAQLERVCNACAAIILPTLTAQELADYNKKKGPILSIRFSSSPIASQTAPPPSTTSASKDTALPSTPPPPPPKSPPKSSPGGLSANGSVKLTPPSHKSPNPNDIPQFVMTPEKIAEVRKKLHDEPIVCTPIAPSKNAADDGGFSKPSPPRRQLTRQASKKAPDLPSRTCPPPIPARRGNSGHLDTVPQASEPTAVVVKSHRQLVIEEVLSTEETYVRNLGMMLNGYALPLLADSRARKPITGKVCFISSEDNLASMSVFFHSIEQIHTLNCQLLEDLRTRVLELQQEETRRASNASLPSTITIGDIFSKYGPLFSLYSQYTDTQEFAAKTLSEYAQKNKEFRDFVTQAEESMSTEKSKIYLQSLLITPIQRVPRYHLLLQECQKQTQKIDPSHIDLPMLQDAIDRVKDSASYINGIVHVRENKAKILVLEQQWNGFQLCIPGRVLIKDGPLHKQCRHKVKTFQFLLFSDVLMYGEESATGSTVTHHRTMGLETCRVADMQETTNDCVSFQIISKQKAFVVYADSAEEKDEWIAALSQSMSARKRTSHRIKPKSTTSEVEANRSDSHPSTARDDEVYAAVWVPNKNSNECQRCGSGFSLFKRRHHCRLCGVLACDECTRFRLTIESIDDKPVRVCSHCYDDHVIRQEKLENERKFNQECAIMTQQKKASITHLSMNVAVDNDVEEQTEAPEDAKKVDVAEVKAERKVVIIRSVSNVSKQVAVTKTTERTSDESSSSDSAADTSDDDEEEDDDDAKESQVSSDSAAGTGATPEFVSCEGTDASGAHVVFPITVQALYTFESSSEGELGVKANEIFTIKQEHGDWWLGRNCNDVRGWLPKTYVRVLSDHA